MRIGIDAGGTFTDFVVLDDKGLRTFKLRSDPASPASVILAGLQQVLAGPDSDVVHGSTVATNALLERKGARTALVTTAGFEDVFEIGRQNRSQLYVLNPPPKRMLIPAEMRYGVGERTWFDGTIASRPDDLSTLKRTLEGAGVESVAICFLHSYANPENEAQALQELAGPYYVCASHRVSPEFREYERTSTTVLNAYVGPLIDKYVAELEQGAVAGISIMQSNGGLITSREAREHAVRTLLSGPAGGVIGAVGVAGRSEHRNIIAFDMGGTSTDVSISEGVPRYTMEAAIDGFPIRVPVLDIHTVGAGGGSIARVDEGGLLRVGPESAGADPGPACYGTGTEPTVTDAHVVLGRIGKQQFLGGTMEIDPERAQKAVEQIGSRLGISLEEAATGILRVANANMQRAIRVVSVERGHDPRKFALVAFGGCGGLHACEIAEELGIKTVLVPEHAGVLSALGMLMADRVRDYAAAALGRADHDYQFRALEAQARRDLPGAKVERFTDVRYEGQSYEITIPSGGNFHHAHDKLYGYASPERRVEIVALRVRATEKTRKIEWDPPRAVRGEPELRRIKLESGWVFVNVYQRGHASRKPVGGPALFADYGATTYVPAGWTARCDETGSLVLTWGTRRRAPS